MAARRWFTPSKGDSDYLPSYQDFNRLVAYAHVTYAATASVATVELRATHKDSSVALTYILGGQAQSSPSRSFNSSGHQGPLSLEVRGADGSSIELDPVDFVWSAPPVHARRGDFRNGQKGAIVEMFGWPDADVEQECSFLAQAGYLGVKLFPHQEQLMSAEPFQNILNPWYLWLGSHSAHQPRMHVRCMYACQPTSGPRGSALCVHRPIGCTPTRRGDISVRDV